MSYALESGSTDANGQSAVVIGDGPNLDAFSRLRISGIDTIFDSSFQYDLQPLIYEAKTANGGAVAHDADLVSAGLSVSAQACTDQHTLLAKIPGSRLSVYEGAGHALHWEEPRRVAVELSVFVSSIETQSR